MAFHCVGKSSSSVERKRSWFSYETVGLIAAWTLCIRPAGCLHLRETRALRSVHLHGCLDVRLCVLNVFHHHQRHFYFRSSSHWKKLKEISRKKNKWSRLWKMTDFLTISWMERADGLSRRPASCQHFWQTASPFASDWFFSNWFKFSMSR